MCWFVCLTHVLVNRHWPLANVQIWMVNIKWILMMGGFTEDSIGATTWEKFQTRQTQTDLCIHRRWVEAWNFQFRRRRIVPSLYRKQDADQLCSNCTADLLLCFWICQKIWFSHDAAHWLESLLELCTELVLLSDPIIYWKSVAWWKSIKVLIKRIWVEAYIILVSISKSNLFSD